MAYLYLAIAIVAEVIATMTLKATEGFTRFIPSVIVTVGYVAAFYCLSLTLKDLPISIVYATWSGLGIVLISLFGYLFYQQLLDLTAIIGIVLIVIGVVLVNLFSKATVA